MGLRAFYAASAVLMGACVLALAALAGASALFGVTGLLTLASAVLAWAVLPGRVPVGLRPEVRPGASSG